MTGLQSFHDGTSIFQSQDFAQSKSGLREINVPTLNERRRDMKKTGCPRRRRRRRDAMHRVSTNQTGIISKYYLYDKAKFQFRRRNG
jgi:hypothetical protein